MEPIAFNSYETVLDVVRAWPPDKRFLLVQDVMKTLESTFHAAYPRRPTVDEALGLLATDLPAPSDAEVEQWLEDHRMEKYG